MKAPELTMTSHWRLLTGFIVRLLMIVLVFAALTPNTPAYASDQSKSSAIQPTTVMVPTLSDANATLPVGQAPTTRDIIIEWMETQSGQDRFYPDFIVVNQGDTVDLTFINNDTVAHDLVISAPYNIVVNASVPGLYDDVTGQRITTPALNNSPGVQVTGTPGNVSASYSFVAKYPGIFEYVCTYHIQVGMIGYLVVLPAASNTSRTTQPIASNQTVTQSPNTAQVSVDAGSGLNDNLPGYTPVDITVVIGVNNTVMWTNNDNMPHTVTATDGSFDSGNLNPGKSYVHTFAQAGSYLYICVYHHWMHGTVTVLSGTGSPQQQSQGYGNVTVVLTGNQIYGMLAFAVVVLVALMIIFSRTRRNSEQTSSA